jgi:hypothetical protein
MRLIRTTTVLMLVLALAACGDDELPTAPDPVAPTTVTETFSGTLTRNGAVTHNFSSQASGTVTVTLSTLAPDSALIVGMSLGTWNLASSTCQLVITKDNATQAAVVTGGVSSFASLCVRVYDVGNITEAVTYEISVVHP